MHPYSTQDQLRCSDAGWVSDSPRWCREAPLIARPLGNIPPEFPRETILKVDYMSVLVVFLTLIRRLEMWARKGLRGKHFRPENSPEIKIPDRFAGRGLDFGRGGRIRTDDLRVMSPTSYQTAPPRNMWNSVFGFQCCDVGYKSAFPVSGRLASFVCKLKIPDEPPF